MLDKSAIAANGGVSPSILILDYKNDFADDQKFVERVGAQISLPRELPIEMIGSQDRTGENASYAGEGVAEILEKLFDNIGGNQLSNIGRATEEMILAGELVNPTNLLNRYKGISDKEMDGVIGALDRMVRLRVFTDRREM